MKSGVIIVEKFIIGKDYWLFVINNKLVVVVLCILVYVIGDGKFMV